MLNTHTNTYAHGMPSRAATAAENAGRVTRCEQRDSDGHTQRHAHLAKSRFKKEVGEMWDMLTHAEADERDDVEAFVLRLASTGRAELISLYHCCTDLLTVLDFWYFGSFDCV